MIGPGFRVAILALFALPTLAHADILYNLVDLGTLGGAHSLASGINNNGEIVGNADTGAVDGAGNAIAHAFLWSNGHVTDLGTPPGGVSSSARAINDLGQIAGSYSDGTHTRAFLLDHGTFTDLGTLGGTTSSATGINSLGAIVGFASTAQNTTHAFLYDHGTMTDLTPTSATDFGSTATGINSNGQISINSHSGPVDSSGSSGLLYQPSGLTVIPDTISAWAINANGMVVGQPRGSSHGYIYSAGSSQQFGPFATVPHAINSYGQVVGTLLAGITPNAGFLYSGGNTVDLNTLVDPSLGWHLGGATGINDLGQIVGSGTNSGGQTDAFLLNPVPEPGCLAPVFVVLSIVLSRQRAFRFAGRGCRFGRGIV